MLVLRCQQFLPFLCHIGFAAISLVSVLKDVVCLLFTFYTLAEISMVGKIWLPCSAFEVKSVLLTVAYTLFQSSIIENLDSLHFVMI